MTYSENITCPVPREQIPKEEYISLKESWFFSWPLLDKNQFYTKLIISWISIFPLSLIIATGSINLRRNLIMLLIIAAICSFFIPLLLLTRQLLGWTYIFSRLESNKIIYEESGWYDGMIWEKPSQWRSQDLLIAKYEVKPIIASIKKPILFNLLFLTFGLLYISFVYN